MSSVCVVCGDLNFETQQKRLEKPAPETDPLHLYPWKHSIKHGVEILTTTRYEVIIKKTATNGCKTCRLVGDALDCWSNHFQPGTFCLELGPGIIQVTEQLSAGTIYQQRSLQFYVLPGVSVYLQSHLGSKSFLADPGYTGSSLPWPGFPRHEDLSRNGLPEASVRFVASQLRLCQQSHDSCKLEGAWNPTRLLDIGGARSAMMTLVDGTACETHGTTTTTPEQVEYAALSYCWGEDTSAQATESSILSLRGGIMDTEAPRTVRDAAQFARRLGIRYLWVDRMCILQDSVEDWELESAQMARVYRHALVTLAASTAKCASVGFTNVVVDPWKMKWAIYKEPTVLDVPFEIAGGSTSDGKVMVRVRKSPVHVDHESRTPAAEETQPLNRRAWVLQESILSTRFVAFEENELTWRCNSSTTCECKAIEFPATMQRRSIRSVEKPADVYSFWRYCVARYSWCHVTNIDDKFPAISGIASTVHQLTGSEYIAGIWSADVAKGLAWTRNIAGDRHLFPSFTRPNEYSTMAAPTSSFYHAPTFSWASIDGHGVVSYDGFDSDGDCTLVRHNVQLKGQNKFGGIHQGGSITIRGLVLPAEAKFNAPQPGDTNPTIHSPTLTQFMHAGLDEPCGVFKLDSPGPGANDSALCRLVRRREAGAAAAIAEEGQERLKSQNRPLINPATSADGRLPVELVMLGKTSLKGDLMEGGTDKPRWSYCFLVLGRCPENQAAYERLGLGVYRSENEIILLEGLRTEITLV